MPTQVVDVDLETETGAVVRETFSDLLIIARDPSVSSPDYNVPNVYDTVSQVASDFGSDSDAQVAAEEVSARGARNWWVIMLESHEHTEVIGDSDSSSTDEGQVQNTPMRGGEENTEVTVDGDAQDLVFSTASPPDKPDTGQTAINTDTGEVVTGSSSSGSGSGIEVSYETLSWDEAQPEIESHNFDLAVLADTRADRSYLGEGDEMLSWVSSNDASMVLAYSNGNTFDTDEEGMDEAHEMGNYLTSGNVFPIAHKSNDDVAAGVAGRMATRNPWFTAYMDGGANYSFAMEQYRRSLIGRPSTPGTFEGGDTDGGGGPCNVLYREMGTQILSNSLSTAGADSDYQYFDIARTESFIVAEVENALYGLRLSRESIPFAPIGRTIIEATLRERLNRYVSPQGRALSPEEIEQLGADSEQAFQLGPQRVSTHRGNVPLSNLDIHVPRYDELDRSDRANRVWTGIQITAQLAGNAHTFQVDLAVTV